MMNFKKMSVLGAAVAILFYTSEPGVAQGSPDEPIAYIGHGAFFDRSGTEISPSLKFIDDAQNWYRNALAAKLTDAKRDEFNKLELKLTGGIKLNQQSQLVLNSRINRLAPGQCYN